MSGFKRITYLFLCLFMIVFMLSCIFLIPKNTAKADEVDVGYSYQSSNLFLSIGTLNKVPEGQLYFTFQDLTGSNISLNFSFSMTSYGLTEFGAYNIHIVFNTNSYAGTNDPVDLYQYNKKIGSDGYDILASNAGDQPLAAPGQDTSYDVIFNMRYPGYSTIRGMFGILRQSSFNCNVYKLRIYTTRLDILSLPQGVPTIYSIEYTDVNEHKLRIDFVACYSDKYIPSMFLQDRTYYLTTELKDDQYYQQGYDSGYNIGYNDGNSAGNSAGYQSGYTNGKSDGYNTGYNAGIKDANDFTFLGLFSAIIDAPIQAISGLFNFNIFGYNMQNFCYSLITLAVIITVIRLVLARK